MKHGFRPLVAILLLVCLPGLLTLVLAWTGWRPPGTAGHGVFLRPPPSVDRLTLTTPDGAAFALRQWRGGWSLVYIAPTSCDRPCVAALYGLRMAHLAQGEARPRVRRVVVAASVEQARALAAADPGLRVLTGGDALLAQLGPPAGQVGIYLVDPRGHVILRYPQQADPGDIRKDLAHLLKHSWVG